METDEPTTPTIRRTRATAKSLTSDTHKVKITIMKNNWDNKAFIMCALFDYLETHSECKYNKASSAQPHAASPPQPHLDCIPLYEEIVKLFMMMDNIHDFAKNSRGFKDTYDKYDTTYGKIQGDVDWNSKINKYVEQARHIAEAKIRLNNIQAVKKYKSELELYINYTKFIIKNINDPNFDVVKQQKNEDHESLNKQLSQYHGENEFKIKNSTDADSASVGIESQPDIIEYRNTDKKFQKAQKNLEKVSNNVISSKNSLQATYTDLHKVLLSLFKFLSRRLQTNITAAISTDQERSLNNIKDYCSSSILELEKTTILSKVQKTQIVSQINNIKDQLQLIEQEYNTHKQEKEKCQKELGIKKGELDKVFQKIGRERINNANTKASKAQTMRKIANKVQTQINIYTNSIQSVRSLCNELKTLDTNLISNQDYIDIYNLIKTNTNIHIISYLVSKLNNKIDSSINKFIDTFPEYSKFLYSQWKNDHAFIKGDHSRKPILRLKKFPYLSNDSKLEQEAVEILKNRYNSLVFRDNIILPQNQNDSNKALLTEAEQKVQDAEQKVMSNVQGATPATAASPASASPAEIIFSNQHYNELNPIYNRFYNYLVGNIGQENTLYDVQKIKIFSEALKILKPKNKKTDKYLLSEGTPESKRKAKAKPGEDEGDNKVADICGSTDVLKKLLVDNLNSYILKIFKTGGTYNSKFTKVFIDPYKKYLPTDYTNIIYNLRLNCFGTSDFGEQWEKKLLTVLCKWGRIKTVKMLKYQEKGKINARTITDASISSDTVDKLKRNKYSMTVKGQDLIPTFYTYYIKQLKWSHDMITSKERRLGGFLNSNLSLSSDDGKIILLPSISKTFLVTSYFDGCKGTKSGSFGTEVLRDRDEIPNGFSFELNFSDSKEGEKVMYIYTPGDYISTEGKFAREFPENFGKGNTITEQWTKTKEEIADLLEDEEEEEEEYEEVDKKTKKTEEKEEKEEDDEKEQNEQEEDEDIIIEGQEQTCEKLHTNCIWKRVDNIIIKFTSPFEDKLNANNVVKEYNQSQDNISLFISIDKQVDSSDYNIAQDASSSTLLNLTSIDEHAKEDDQGPVVAAASSMDYNQSTVDNSNTFSSQDTYKTKNLVKTKAEGHLQLSKVEIRNQLHLDNKNSQYEEKNDYYRNIDMIKSITDDQKYNIEKKIYKDKISNECKSYIDNGKATEFVNDIGFFTTLKCIGDFSQCIEAYKRDCLFMAADAMQFILGCTVGTKMVKNHGWDFWNDIGKYYWISDSLFNYIYNQFKTDDKFYNNVGTNRKYFYLEESIGQNKLLETYLDMFTSRNEMLCNFPKYPNRKIYEQIYPWFSITHHNIYKILHDGDDQDIIIEYNKENIIALLDFQKIINSNESESAAVAVAAHV